MKLKKKNLDPSLYATWRLPHSFIPLVSYPYFFIFFGLVYLYETDAKSDIKITVQSDGSRHISNSHEAKSKRKSINSKSEKNAVYNQPRTRPKSKSNSSEFGQASPDASRYHRYDAWISEAAQFYQLPAELLRAVIRVESDFSPALVSRAGAKGLMQIMPDTALYLDLKDLLDPRENIYAGARYLRILANHFNGDLTLTVAAYNSGEEAVLRHRGIPPYEETKKYVDQVIRFYYEYKLGP